MRDFFGREIRPGDYLVTGGSGNSGDEYGMILHRALKTTGKGYQTVRLKITYGIRPKALSRRTTIRNGNRYLIVQPPEQLVALFELVIEGAGAFTPSVAAIQKWLQGTAEDAYPFLPEKT